MLEYFLENHLCALIFHQLSVAFQHLLVNLRFSQKDVHTFQDDLLIKGIDHEFMPIQKLYSAFPFRQNNIASHHATVSAV
jgi:hypothetical protein